MQKNRNCKHLFFIRLEKPDFELILDLFGKKSPEQDFFFKKSDSGTF